ncbi:unnamed protein product [Ixodes hexagonus]
MATPSDSTRIVVPKALSFDGTEDAEDILLSCIAQNPQCQALAARRMGKSQRYRLPYEARGPRHTSTLMGSLSPVSRTGIESRRVPTVDERTTVPTCVPCHPRTGATGAEPNTRRKTKMARPTSVSPCAPSAGAGTSRPPKNAHIAMFAALKDADRRRRNLRSNHGGPAGRRPKRFQESKCIEESQAQGRQDGVGDSSYGRC